MRGTKGKENLNDHSLQMSWLFIQKVPESQLKVITTVRDFSWMIESKIKIQKPIVFTYKTTVICNIK